jgi:hypothetical protein
MVAMQRIAMPVFVTALLTTTVTFGVPKKCLSVVASEPVMQLYADGYSGWLGVARIGCHAGSGTGAGFPWMVVFDRGDRPPEAVVIFGVPSSQWPVGAVTLTYKRSAFCRESKCCRKRVLCSPSPEEQNARMLIKTRAC